MVSTAYNVPTYCAPPLLLKRFEREHRCTRERAEEIFAETKKFLALCAASRQESFSPSQMVDEMWHEFMCFSEDYFAFCKELGGEGFYIHHRPSEEPNPEGYKRTRAAIKEHYGELNQKIWPAPPKAKRNRSHPAYRHILDCTGYCGSSHGDFT